ncbi:MAG TPA: ATP-binding protein [Gemmatimonadaceae bacterium]|nr:ATP-binding protein [Gemmatimonadaceae bacterium]
MTTTHKQDAGLEPYRELLKQAPVACSVVDPDGRVLFWNGEAERLFGWKERDVLGRVPPGLPPDAMQAMYTHIRATMEGNPVRGVEVVRTRRDGTNVNVLVHTASLRDRSGDVVGIMAMFMDMTTRRQVEIRMRNAQKMEAIGLLAGGVAHDFNNLLTAIKGFSALLLEATGENVTARECVDEIVKAAERAAGLTGQLLAFSRRQLLRPQVVDLNGRLESMLPMLRMLATPAVQVEPALGAGLGTLLVDPVQLEQVVLNLVTNARDAIEERGQVTIRTSSVTLDEEFAKWGVSPRPGPYIRLDVVDTGAGMDALSISRAFDPFYTTKSAGTGLGLATVFGIVKQSGGYVWITETSPTGTTISVYLPEADEAAVQAALERAAAVQGEAERTEAAVEAIREEALLKGARTVSRKTDAESPDAPVLRLVPGSSQREPRPGTRALDQPRPAPPLRLTILLVDDDGAVRDMIRRTLERMEHTVLDAPSGEEAMKLVHLFNEPLDLLITDIRMPGMTGLELRDRFIAERKSARVLFISGHAEEFTGRELRDAHTQVLVKPFTGDQLDQAIHQVMGHAQPAG